MAVDMDDDTGDFFENSGGIMPITGAPFSMAAWFRPDTDTDISMVLTFVDASVGNQQIRLDVRGDKVGDPVRAFTFDGGTGDELSTTTGITANTWHHCCRVDSAVNNRSVFLDGGGKATNTVSLTPTGIDTMSVGRIGTSTPEVFVEGAVAEVAVWDVALSDAEVAILAAGFSPLFVRPASLKFYRSFIRNDDVDVIGGLVLTKNGTGNANFAHPRMIYPSRPHIITAPAAAAGGRLLLINPPGLDGGFSTGLSL